MPQQPTPYEIDDNKTVDENLADLAQALSNLDDPLASVLTPCLVVMSSGAHTDNSGLLNALYAKTAPAPSEVAAISMDGPAAAPENGQ